MGSAHLARNDCSRRGAGLDLLGQERQAVTLKAGRWSAAAGRFCMAITPLS